MGSHVDYEMSVCFGSDTAMRLDSSLTYILKTVHSHNRGMCARAA